MCYLIWEECVFSCKWYTRGGHRTTFGSQFSPHTMCVPGIKRTVLKRMSPEISFERYDFFETIDGIFFSNNELKILIER